MRGIFFREQLTNFPWPLFFKEGESIDWSVPTENSWNEQPHLGKTISATLLSILFSIKPAAATSRPVLFSLSLPSHIQGRREAKLLRKSKEIRDPPVLGDLAVAHPHDVYRFEVDLASGRR